MKIYIEVEIPEYEWVDTTTEYSTPICNVTTSKDLRSVERFLDLLKRMPDIHNIINLSHDVRCMLCKELVSRNLNFLKDSYIEYVAINLSNFLSNFKPHTGLKIEDYNFIYEKVNDGKMIKFKNFELMFHTEKEAFKHITKNYLLSKDFKYNIMEK